MFRKICVILLSVFAVMMLFSRPDAQAVADGNGICEASEATVYDCAAFGTNSIEFLGTVPVTINGKTFKRYDYFYNGVSTNQINVAIPLKFTQLIVQESNPIPYCSQWYEVGGDPTTGFGAYFSQFGTCRIAPTGTSFPNISIVVDLSYVDRDNPLNWLVRISKNEVYTGLIVGPWADTALVISSGTLTAGDKTVSFESQDGDVIITSGVGYVLNLNQTKICFPTQTGMTITFTTSIGENFTCETINSLTDKCTIGTTGSDPLIYENGRLIWIP